MNNLIKILFSFILIISCDDNPVSPIYGCTNQSACNFNPDATIFYDTCEYSEENYDCDGNCTIEADCLGVCGGTAVLDECGVCDGSGIDNEACDCNANILDCAGVCGGTSVEDECGLCGGDGSSCIEFTKNDGADPSLLENQDCIVNNICLTRGNNGALYNAFYYTSYNEMLNAYENGDNPLIKWSEGTVEQAQNGELVFYNGLTNEAGNFGQLVQLPDRNIVAYLVEHEIYLNFDFLSWSSGQQGGGFSYLRDIPNILQ